MTELPLYRWTLADYGSENPSKFGFATAIDDAKGALVSEIVKAGGLHEQMTAIVHRPSGGGWIARAAKGGVITVFEEFGNVG